MKVRAIYREDGGVSIVHPNSKKQKKGETENAFLKRVFDKATPEGAEYEDIEPYNLLTRKTRQFWKGKKGEGLSIDFDKKTEKETEDSFLKKIEGEKQNMAIEALKGKGELPQDY